MEIVIAIFVILAFWGFVSILSPREHSTEKFIIPEFSNENDYEESKSNFTDPKKNQWKSSFDVADFESRKETYISPVVKNISIETTSKVDDKNYLQKNRFTHCYKCKSTLSSRVHKECDDCGWLICPSCFSCEYNCTSDHGNPSYLHKNKESSNTHIESSNENNEIDPEFYSYSENYDDFPDNTEGCDQEIDTDIDYGYGEELSWEERH